MESPYGPGIAVITLPGTINSNNNKNSIESTTKPIKDNGNALSPEGSRQVFEQVIEADSDPSVLAIVIRANGRFFCTGMDLSKALSSQNVENNGKDGSESSMQESSGPEDLFECIASAKKPVICAMQGPALGGGTGIMFACDFRFATAGSYIQFPEVTRGLVPALIAAYIVPQLGLFQAKQLMLRGSSRVPVEELYRLGAINGVARAATTTSTNDVNHAAAPTSNGQLPDLDDLVRQVCDELRQSAPEAAAMTKKLCRTIALDCNSHTARIAASKDVFAQMMVSEEAAHGIGMFMQRQKPDWIAFNAEQQKQRKEEREEQQRKEEQGEEDAVRAKL